MITDTERFGKALVSLATPSLTGEDTTFQWFVLAPQKSWGVNELVVPHSHEQTWRVHEAAAQWNALCVVLLSLKRLETTALLQGLQGKFPHSEFLVHPYLV
jgi:hypothetical protein